MTWQVALQLGRVSNLPTVWTNTLAASVLVGVVDSRLWPLLVAMSLYYIGGMYLNDAFDADIDARERPERPIPSGQVSRVTVYVAGFAMLALATVIVFVVARSAGQGLALWATVSGLALAAMIVLYDWYHKANPLSPLIMGLCRVLVYVTTALCFAAVVPAGLRIAALVVLCYLIGLTYVAKQENFGRVENLWPLAFLAAPLIYGLVQLAGEPLTGIFLVALVGWIVYCVRLVMRRGSGDIPRAVVSLIAGIALLDAMLIASAGQLMLAVLAVIGFVLTLFLQRYVSGT